MSDRCVSYVWFGSTSDTRIVPVRDERGRVDGWAYETTFCPPAQPEATMTRYMCCEVCERNPTCGVDCGSCDATEQDEPAPKLHDVDWNGCFRGTDEDPRECGWCNVCGREVYDGDGPDHRVSP